MVVVNPPDALDHVESFAVRVSHAVQLGLVVEIHGVRDQRLSLPMPDRVPHPQGTQSRVMLGAVRKYLMPEGVPLEKQDDLAGRLNDLHRQWVKISNRET